MSCAPGYSKRERALLDALRHLMGKDHALDPKRCEGCRDIAAFIAIPGHAGIEHPEVH